MFHHIRLQNFKSWQDTGELHLAPLTGFWGANSSGKTSLLQALLLLKQTVDATDRNMVLDFGERERNSLVELGDFKSVVHNHSESAEIGIELSWEVIPALPSPKSAKEMVARELGFQWQSSIKLDREQRLFTSEMEYKSGQRFAGIRPKEGTPYEFYSYEPIYRSSPISWAEHFEPPKCYRFSPAIRIDYQNVEWLADFELAFENRMRSVYYLGPLRAKPQRYYSWSGNRPSDVGSAGEQTIQALLASRTKFIAKDTAEFQVAEWLKKLGLVADFRIEAVSETSQIYQVWVKKTATSAEVLLTDVGFGVSQILPVLTLCFYAPQGSVIILEQPEIHLHPAIQSGLADVLLDAIERRGIQIILESHSEHLLRRLQRRIAEASVSEKGVALYFCEAGETASKITPLDLDEYGNIRNCPQEFFGDVFGELATTQRARLERKMEPVAK